MNETSNNTGGLGTQERSSLRGQLGFILDGHIFEKFDIEGNQFIYLGGPVPQFHHCDLKNNGFSFQGSAMNTMTFLAHMMNLFSLEEREEWLRGFGLLKENEGIASIDRDG